MLQKSESLVKALSSFDELLFFPSIPWDHSYERQQHVISAFCAAQADGRKFCFEPTGLIDYAPWNFVGWNFLFSKIIKKNKHSEGGHHSYNHPFPGGMNYIIPKFPRGTNKIFVKFIFSIDENVRAAFLKKGRRLVYATNVNPFIEEFLETADFSILDLAERRQKNPSLSAKFKAMEAKWASVVDLLVADSRVTLSDYDHLRGANGRSMGFYIPQGVTYEHASRPLHPQAKVAAYLGNLHSAIDYSYLEKILNANPGWKFKMCGAIMTREAERIVSHPGVDYVGSIKQDEISGFLSEASIGLIPYLINEHTAGIFPTKLFEYFAHGLPVLSTPLPEMLDYAQTGLLRISSDALVLDEIHFEKDNFSDILKCNTWQARFDSFGHAIQEVL